jgi:hypothetical protein
MSRIFSNAGRRQKHSLTNKPLPVVALSTKQAHAADTFVVSHPSPQDVKAEKQLGRKCLGRPGTSWYGKLWLAEAVTHKERYGSMSGQWIE